MGHVIFLVVWYSIIVTLLFFIGKFLFSQIKNEFVQAKKEFGGNTAKEDAYSANPFDDAEAEMRRKKSFYEEGFGIIIGTIAVIAAICIFYIIYVLATDTFFKFIKDIEENKQISDPIVILSSFTLGIAFSQTILLGKKNARELFEGHISTFFHRRRGLIMGFLAFIFFALLHTLIAELDFKYNIIKSLTLSFISGSLIYIIFRYYNYSWKMQAFRKMLQKKSDRFDDEADSEKERIL